MGPCYKKNAQSHKHKVMIEGLVILKRECEEY
jgi:hypothetical protein